jgi:DNA-binding IclR family transcriptional regulator
VLGREQTLHAMLSIQGPANRLHVGRMAGLGVELRQAADAVGAALGGRASPA